MKEEMNEQKTNCKCNHDINNDNNACGTNTDECNCKNNCECHVDKKDKKKDKYKEKINELENKIKELEEQNLRSKAELINYRKRKDDEISKLLKYSSEDIVKEVLPIVDNFERAINMDDDNLADDISKFLAGFKMIYCKLVSILEKNGVKAIDGNNKPFDPTYHQAVLTEAREGVEPGMVLEVLQRGYLLKDKVIRPAMVKVSE